MTKVLVTGMSGTGKSSALAELGRHGFRVVDTDEPGWAEWVASVEEVGGGEWLGRLASSSCVHEDRSSASTVARGCGYGKSATERKLILRSARSSRI